MMGSGCDCPTCERAKSEQAALTAPERQLLAGVERLQQEQEREVLGRLDIPGVDPEQIVFDLDEWADRYGDALKDVLLSMLGAGWRRRPTR